MQRSSSPGLAQEIRQTHTQAIPVQAPIDEVCVAILMGNTMNTLRIIMWLGFAISVRAATDKENRGQFAKTFAVEAKVNARLEELSKLPYTDEVRLAMAAESDKVPAQAKRVEALFLQRLHPQLPEHFEKLSSGYSLLGDSFRAKSRSGYTDATKLIRLWVAFWEAHSSDVLQKLAAMGPTTPQLTQPPKQTP